MRSRKTPCTYAPPGPLQGFSTERWNYFRYGTLSLASSDRALSFPR